MTPYLVIPIVAAAAAVLLGLGRWVRRRGGAGLVRNAAVDQQLLYQPLSAVVAVATAVLVRLAVPHSADFLHVGQLRAPVSGLGWLGLGATETWLRLGLTLGLVITAVTGVVVWLQAARSRSIATRHVPPALLVALPLAACNAAVEEAIFRLAPSSALAPIAATATIAVLSGVLFGVPHYFGNPGRLPGALLAGFLGWLLCLSVLQTHGVFWAWGVHFLQDVVIFTILIAVSATTAARRTLVPRGAKK